MNLFTHHPECWECILIPKPNVPPSGYESHVCPGMILTISLSFSLILSLMLSWVIFDLDFFFLSRPVLSIPSKLLHYISAAQEPILNRAASESCKRVKMTVCSSEEQCLERWGKNFSYIHNKHRPNDREHTHTSYWPNHSDETQAADKASLVISVYLLDLAGMSSHMYCQDVLL